MLVLYCFCQVCTEIERLEELAQNSLNYFTCPKSFCYYPFPYWPRRKPKRSKSAKKFDKQRELFNLLANKNRQVRKTFYFSESLRRPKSTGQLNINQNHINKYQNYYPRTPKLEKQFSWNNERCSSQMDNVNISSVDEYIQAQTDKMMLPSGECQYFSKGMFFTNQNQRSDTKIIKSRLTGCSCFLCFSLFKILKQCKTAF